MIDKKNVNVTAPIWIDPFWLSWKPFWDTKDPVLNDGTLRLYEIHQHACDRLASNNNDFDRSDAIVALRRVVGGRVKALMNTYRLRDLPIGARPKYDLELLESFGIIRPFMLRRLIEIRNIVEHQDSNPPPIDECLMFADLIWYFLRSTDGLARMQVGTLIFRPQDRTSGKLQHEGAFEQVQLHFPESSSEALEIDAWLHSPVIANKYTEKLIKIEPTEIKRHDYPDDFWIILSGRICGTEGQMKFIYDLYFKTSHLGGLYYPCRRPTKLHVTLLLSKGMINAFYLARIRAFCCMGKCNSLCSCGNRRNIADRIPGQTWS